MQVFYLFLTDTLDHQIAGKTTNEKHYNAVSLISYTFVLFFRSNKTVCAVGFEPNSELKVALEGVEKSYNSCGWRVGGTG